MFSLKCILNVISLCRYFISGCDVKLSLKFILNHYWNNYFNSGRYFNSGCNTATIAPVPPTPTQQIVAEQKSRFFNRLDADATVDYDTNDYLWISDNLSSLFGFMCSDF